MNNSLNAILSSQSNYNSLYIDKSDYRKYYPSEKASNFLFDINTKLFTIDLSRTIFNFQDETNFIETIANKVYNKLNNRIEIGFSHGGNNSNIFFKFDFEDIKPIILKSYMKSSSFNFTHNNLGIKKKIICMIMFGVIYGINFHFLDNNFFDPFILEEMFSTYRTLNERVDNKIPFRLHGDKVDSKAFSYKYNTKNIKIFALPNKAKELSAYISDKSIYKGQISYLANYNNFYINEMIDCILSIPELYKELNLKGKSDLSLAKAIFHYNPKLIESHFDLNKNLKKFYLERTVIGR